MNESTLTRLKVLVERAVRPVRASEVRKRRMREELLAHLSAVFEEEAVRLEEERAALERTEQRFGSPAELSGQLQESVPQRDRLLRWAENVFLMPGLSTFRRAYRLALLLTLLFGGFLLPAFFVQGRLSEWPTILAIPVITFSCTFVVSGMRQALYGPAGRSWAKAALVAGASCFIVPVVTFGLVLTYSGDAGSSLLTVLPLLPVSALTPVAAVLAAHLSALECRYHDDWASLPIH